MVVGVAGPRSGSASDGAERLSAGPCPIVSERAFQQIMGIRAPWNHNLPVPGSAHCSSFFGPNRSISVSVSIYCWENERRAQSDLRFERSLAYTMRAVPNLGLEAFSGLTLNKHRIVAARTSRTVLRVKSGQLTLAGEYRLWGDPVRLIKLARASVGYRCP